MPLIIVVLAVLFLVALIVLFKFDPFLAFIIVALFVGLAQGMDPLAITASIQMGLGNTLGFLVLILGFGAMIGKLVADSGAARRISIGFMDLFGKKNIRWALMVAGFVVGIPMFFAVGFVILVPIVFTIAASARIPLVYLALPMITALSVTHGFLPPHPAPSALVGEFGADMAHTLLYGFLIGIPAIIIGGLWFSRSLKNIDAQPLKIFFDQETEQDKPMPGFITSILTALAPVIIILVAAVMMLYLSEDTFFGKMIGFVGDPVVAMLISLLIAMYVLGVRQGVSIKDVTESMTGAVKDIALILLVIGGAGALKQVMADSGVSDYIAISLGGVQVSALLLGWGIAALIRIAIGSATVAALTSAGIIAPLAAQQGIDPNLMVIGIGAGSLIFSHVNDSGFWLFKEYFNLSIRDTLKSWSAMETIVAMVGLIGVILFDMVL